MVQDVADPSTTYADFPVLVYATGLSNIEAGGADIRFTSSDGITELPREIESYAGGTLYAWVKVTLTKDSSDSSDDVIYMYYGNSSATEPDPSSPYGSENVWDTDFVMVQHLQETSGTHFDSTSYSNDSSYVLVTQQGTASGKINGTDEFDGIDDYITIVNSSDINIGIHGQRTVSAWFNVADTAARQVIFEEGAGIRGLNMYIDSGNLYVGAWNEPSGESNWQGTWLSTAINPNTWYHVVAWLDGGSTITPNALKGYLNGVEFGSGDGSQLWGHSGDIAIGRNGGSKFHDGDDTSAGECFDGLIDEVQISNTPRDAEWIITGYNNQEIPGGFGLIGSEETLYASSGSLASQVFDSGPGAAWYDSAWSYRRPVTLSPVTSVANYPVLVTLTTATMGNPYTGVNADGSDIRFTGADKTTLQDHWVESWDSTGTSTIWVEVQASGTSTVYMYYGNAAASSASDGDSVFDFFDDFGDGDISDWSQYGSGTVQVANDGGNSVLLKTISNDPNGGYSIFNNGALSDFEVVFRTKRINETGGAQNRYGIEDGSYNGYGPRMADFNSLPAAFAIERRTSGVGSNIVSTNTSAYECNTWMTVKFRKYGSTLEFELYNSLGSLVESITTTDSSYNSFDRFVVHGGWEFYTDDIRVRKYVSSESVTSLGSQELPDTTSWIGLSWDETLAGNTDITFEVRASDTPFAKDAVSPSWVAVGGTSPVVSGLPSGRYMQWRATLTTSDPANTPILHEVIIYYD